MDVGQLRYFTKIVEHRSFTKAAKHCLVSQPALSQQIGKLERELGQPLFERQGRTIRLTPAGQLLHRKAEKILLLIEDAKRQVADDGETGQISMSAVASLASYMLPVILGKVGQQFPQIDWNISEDSSEALIKKVSDGDLDLGFLTTPVSSRYLHVEPLFEEVLYVALPAQHRLAAQSTLQIDDLCEEPFVMPSDEDGLASTIEEFCNANNFQPQVSANVQQLLTVQSLVAMEHGLSFVPAMATGLSMDGRIAYRKLTGDQPKRSVAICWNPYRYQCQLQKNFIASVREFCEGFDFASGTEPSTAGSFPSPT